MGIRPKVAVRVLDVVGQHRQCGTCKLLTWAAVPLTVTAPS